VKFDPKADPMFTFDRQSVTMKASGIIVVTQKPASQDWTFTDAEVKDDTLNEFSSEVQGAGQTVHIKDDFRDKSIKSYSYNVTVKTSDNEIFQSPDPVIVNDPGR
jgi:hypothetical protein